VATLPIVAGLGGLPPAPEIMMAAARYVAAHREAAVTADQS